MVPNKGEKGGMTLTGLKETPYFRQFGAWDNSVKYRHFHKISGKSVLVGREQISPYLSKKGGESQQR